MEISIFADACSNDTSNGPLLKIELSDLSSKCFDIFKTVNIKIIKILETVC
jgi:hypothetical protein